MKSFSFNAENCTPGRLYHYEKSNIDGSHKHNVSLYVADIDALESFKWHSDAPEATLVLARMDWQMFSICDFKTWQVNKGVRTLIATESQVDGTNQWAISVSAGSVQFEQVLSIASYPWHSYDFDFASLNVSLRHLVDPLKPFTFGIADPDYDAEDPCFTWKGEVLVEFLTEENREGVDCRKYSINGSGLKNRGGSLWVCKNEDHIVDYEIDLPDEPGFTSGKLRLRKIEQMDRSDWEAFKNMPADRID
jgi:hypothetical protein